MNVSGKVGEGADRSPDSLHMNKALVGLDRPALVKPPACRQESQVKGWRPVTTQTTGIMLTDLISTRESKIQASQKVTYPLQLNQNRIVLRVGSVKSVTR